MSKQNFPTPCNIIIQNVQPEVDHGRFAVRREPGDIIHVYAEVFRHSYEPIAANLLWRARGEQDWKRIPMHPEGNDEWTAELIAPAVGYYEYTIEAWTINPADSPIQYDKILSLRVDPAYARFASWYEMYPRSQGTVENAYATWKDCTSRLDEIQRMGFDTIYLVPIHPIGFTNRKGKNNSLKALPGEPGCPYAIGNADGGHYSLDPNFGTEADFDAFMKEAKNRNFEMALDIALNCSPDHPHVKEHPEWFFHEPDGSIKYAENPPKKYEDVYPYDYFNENWKALWEDVRNMILHWVNKGFNIFRIDNPHTKPFQFWEWIIAEVKDKHPHVIFLAEAFTRPKLMHRLGKLGFDLSYTYFTWRTEKKEIEEYLVELTQSEATNYMRGIFFPTTPDILPWHLQNAGREMFILRLAMAGTLSSIYGMYNGYELCENLPYPNKEEYTHSEKYQYLVRDWNKAGHIKDFIAKFNKIRKENSALHEYDNLRFHKCDNEQILVASKRCSKTGNTLLMVYNLEPTQVHSGWVDLNLHDLGIENTPYYRVHDLVTGEIYPWNGSRNFVILEPAKNPVHIFRIEWYI